MEIKNSMSKMILPKEYVPYPDMTVCGNSFVGGRVPIAIENHPLFLIGTGIKVWFYMSSDDGKWESIILRNEILDARFKISKSSGGVSVYYGLHLVVRADEESDEALNISHLDFRPFGFDIFGTPSGLTVGDNRISDLSFENIETMVGVGNIDLYG